MNKMIKIEFYTIKKAKTALHLSDVVFALPL